MNRELSAVIEAGQGVATRADLLRTVPRHVLDDAAGAGQLVRVLPRVYADPRRWDQPGTRIRAALAYAGPDAALSHLTALASWRLPGGDLDGPVHLTVPESRRLRATRGVVAHRRPGFRAAPPEVVVRRGLPVCCVERSIVDSWALLPRDAGRAAVIRAVGDRRTTPARVLVAIGAHLSLPGRAELLRLVNLLERGCRSELELWGYDHIFTGPDLPDLQRDVPVRLGARTVYLDVYCPAARVNFELDGARWHSSAADRERDARRDAELAALGIMVVRFTHEQLVRHPARVRAQIRAILAARLPGVAG
jgi:hypothetical protein